MRWLNARFDPQERTVAGTTSVSLSPINDGLTEVVLDAGPMQIDSVRLFAVDCKAEVEKIARAAPEASTGMPTR